MDREKKRRSGISGRFSRQAQRQANSIRNGENPKAKSSMRPIRFLLNAYLPEHYKNRTGSTRRSVFGKIWEDNTKIYTF